MVAATVGQAILDPRRRIIRRVTVRVPITSLPGDSGLITRLPPIPPTATGTQPSGAMFTACCTVSTPSTFGIPSLRRASLTAIHGPPTGCRYAVNPDFKEHLSVLNDEQVRYLVVGGYAVSLHAQSRATKNLDTISPDGEHLVTMTAEDDQDLIDARDAAVAMRDIATGTLPTVAEADLDAYLTAPTPLAFWRKHRGLTQIELSQAADMSQPYLAQLETGQREGSVSVYARLAKLLNVRIDDLVAEALPDANG